MNDLLVIKAQCVCSYYHRDNEMEEFNDLKNRDFSGDTEFRTDGLFLISRKNGSCIHIEIVDDRHMRYTLRQFELIGIREIKTLTGLGGRRRQV